MRRDQRFATGGLLHEGGTVQKGVAGHYLPGDRRSAFPEASPRRRERAIHRRNLVAWRRTRLHVDFVGRSAQCFEDAVAVLVDCLGQGGSKRAIPGQTVRSEKMRRISGLT